MGYEISNEMIDSMYLLLGTDAWKNRYPILLGTRLHATRNTDTATRNNDAATWNT